MKRDMELVRSILIEMEKRPINGAGDIEIQGYDADNITYHLGLITHAGLITAIDASSHDGPAWLPQQLTWEGHEFLDAARSDTVWNTAKDHVLRTTGALSLEALKAALALFVRQAVIGKI